MSETGWLSGAARLTGRVRCRLSELRLQQLTFSQRRSNATAAPQPGFVELPECLPCVLPALSTASQGLLRLIEFGAQLRDGSTQELELGALFVAQFNAPIPRLIGLSHRLVFAVRVHRPASMSSRILRSDFVRVSDGTRTRVRLDHKPALLVRDVWGVVLRAREPD